MSQRRLNQVAPMTLREKQIMHLDAEMHRIGSEPVKKAKAPLLDSAKRKRHKKSYSRYGGNMMDGKTKKKGLFGENLPKHLGRG